MNKQRQTDKRAILDALRQGKTKQELSSVMIDYFKKYCVSKDEVNTRRKEAYDELNEPLLSSSNF